MNMQTALATLIATHQNNLENVAATIFDYACDTYVGVDPTIGQALDTIAHNAYNSDEDQDPGLDVCAIGELLAQYSNDLAREFAYAAELCPLCFSDLDVCADDVACPGA